MISDSLLVVIVMFTLVIITFAGRIILTDVNTDLQADDDISAQGKTQLQHIDTNYNSWMDGAIIFALILLWIVVIAMSFFVDSSPLFFIIAILLLIGVLIISAYLSNTYEEITETGEFAVASSGFPMTDYVMSHLFIFILLIALSIGIALYGKGSIEG